MEPSPPPGAIVLRRFPDGTPRQRSDPAENGEIAADPRDQHADGEARLSRRELARDWRCDLRGQLADARRFGVFTRRPAQLPRSAGVRARRGRATRRRRGLDDEPPRPRQAAS